MIQIIFVQGINLLFLFGEQTRPLHKVKYPAEVFPVNVVINVCTARG